MWRDKPPSQRNLNIITIFFDIITDFILLFVWLLKENTIIFCIYYPKVDHEEGNQPVGKWEVPL